MKKVILLVLFVPVMAQGQIVENFEQGVLKNWVQITGDRWKADTAESISGRFSLHHIFDNPDSGTDVTGIPVRNFHPSEGLAKWSFLIRYGSDPSSSNNWSAIIMADALPASGFPDGAASGYALGVNMTGYDDTLRLWKIKGNSVTPVINSHINWQSQIGTIDAVKIIVERTIECMWLLSVHRLNGELITSASGSDSELFGCEWVGLCYRYTSSRDRLLWFDDLSIEGTFYDDNAAPEITGCEVSGKNAVKIMLSEPPADELMISENFSLNSMAISAISVVKETELSYIISFTGEFINRSLYSLSINNICDRDGNCKTNIQVPFTPVWAEKGDVIISEIMADPEPSVSLPGKEYLEITNRTQNSFNMKSWKLTSGDQEFLLPETIIRPLEIMIVCLAKDTSLFTGYGKVAGMKQFPALTDDGKILLLSDSYGKLIHGVEYSPEWYRDELKSEGGWSLEMIDTRYPFSYEGNWVASESRSGGTPGSVNSVAASNPDNSFSGVINVFPEDSMNITVRLSEPAFTLSGSGENINIDGKSSLGIYSADPLFREFLVKPGEQLQRGKVYNIHISAEIDDFAGNRIIKDSYAFGLTEPSESGDILFNELMFNPLPGDPDYMEFYNSSEKIIDASRLQVVSVNDGTGDTSMISQVSEEKRCFLPASYYAVTTDRDKVTDRYFSTDPDCLFEIGSLPSMADDNGHLILYNRELDRIDEVVYNENMQSVLLSGYDGVALEKISPISKSEEVINWHSASESSGWATPGAVNSVFAEWPVTSDNVYFSSTKITPDNDGFEDILVIRFNLTGTNNVVSVMVFDETGNFIRKIASNMYAGPESSLTWDGTADDGSLVNTGIYIVLITTFDEAGKTARWKKACTVIRD